MLNSTPVTAIVLAFTVIGQFAVFEPSVVVTVIVAFPGDIAVTTPAKETVATVGLFDDQVSDLSVAFVGYTVAVRVAFSPSVRDNDVLSKLTLSTGTVFCATDTEHVAVFEPSVVVTDIVAFPADLAVTTP